MSEKHFEISENSVVVTSTYVVQDKMPILYVSHEIDDESGYIWQFHCGNDDYDMSKMLLASLDNILTIDPLIVEVSDLPVGFEARRRFAGDRWTYSRG